MRYVSYVFDFNCSDLFPTLRVGSIHTTVITIRHSRTSAAKAQQLTSTAFLELLILAISVHLFAYEEVVQVVPQCVADLALHASTGIYRSVRQDGKMAVPTVATVIHRIVARIVRRIEQAFFILEQSPQVVFQVEPSWPALVTLESLFKSSCRIWYAAETFSLKYDGHHCLSPAPQALPHALAAFNCLKKRFFNIIIAFEGCMTNLLILLSTTKLDHLFLTDKKLYLCQIVTFFSLLLIDKGLPTQKNCPNLHTPNL